MDMEAIDLYYGIVSCCMLTGTRLATAIFLYILLKNFVKKKRAVIASTSYFILITVLYYIPQVLPNVTAYGISIFCVFLILIIGDASRIRLKAFISVTAFVLRWLAFGSVQQLMMPVIQIMNKLYSKSSILLMNIEFLLTEILQLGLSVLLLGISVRLFLRVYKNVYDELPTKEFVMLLMPMLAQVVGYQSVINYYDLYDKAMRAGVIKPVYEFNYTLLLFYLISYVAILAFLTFYQELKETRENRKEQELLASQVENLKEHIHTVERAYGEIRGMRHDMANHLMTLDGLIENGDHAAAEEYARKIKETISHTESGIKSGNPVTDVIIGEYVEKFKKKKIAFECDFHYPDSEKIDSFDLSIVLFNALQNAYEASVSVQDSFVAVKSFRKKNAFIIEVSNKCDERVSINEITGLPISSKDNEIVHGYGLKNIKRIAQKYYGDMQISTDDGKFILNIMMMLQ